MPTTFPTSLSSIATDPLRNFKFHVNIAKNAGNPGPSLIQMGFTSLTGLSVTTEQLTYRQGGYNTTTQKLPGQSDFTPIQLSRGLIPFTPASWYWIRELFFVMGGRGTGRSGNNFRSNMEIRVFEHPTTSGPSYVKWRVKVYNAWPVSLAYSDLDAGGNALMMEQMVLAHEGWDIKWGGAGARQEAGTF